MVFWCLFCQKKKEQMENKAAGSCSKLQINACQTCLKLLLLPPCDVTGQSVHPACKVIFIQASVAVVTARRADQMDARTRQVFLRTPHMWTVGGDPILKGYQTGLHCNWLNVIFSGFWTLLWSPRVSHESASLRFHQKLVDCPGNAGVLTDAIVSCSRV